MKKPRGKKKGIKVIPPWHIGETENFTSLDIAQDTDIEAVPPDDWDDRQEAETSVTDEKES